MSFSSEAFPAYQSLGAAVFIFPLFGYSQLLLLFNFVDAFQALTSVAMFCFCPKGSRQEEGSGQRDEGQSRGHPIRVSSSLFFHWAFLKSRAPVEFSSSHWEDLEPFMPEKQNSNPSLFMFLPFLSSNYRLNELISYFPSMWSRWACLLLQFDPLWPFKINSKAFNSI